MCIRKFYSETHIIEFDFNSNTQTLSDRETEEFIYVKDIDEDLFNKIVQA